jgi:putative phage-type endonuclease
MSENELTEPVYTIDADNNPHFFGVADIRDVGLEKFLELRKLGIGGSDASAVCGVNKYTTPFQAYLSKVDPTYAIEESFPMAWGTLVQDAVVAMFAKATGIDVYSWPVLLRSKTHSFMQYSPDGVLFVDGKPGLYEGKTTGMKKTWEGGGQTHALVQVQHGMAVTGFEFAYIACVVSNSELIQFRVERDQKFIDRLVEIESAFWARVQAKNPPPIAAEDKDALKTLYPEAGASDLIYPAQYEPLLEGYVRLKALEKAAAAAKEHYESQLKGLMKDAPKLLCGAYEASWTNSSTGSLDAKAIKANHPDIYQKYFRSGTSRRFSVKTTEGELPYDAQLAAGLTEPSQFLTVGVGGGNLIEGDSESHRIEMSGKA